MNAIIAAYRGLSANARGALWMLASALSFTVMTLLVRYLGEGYPAPVQTFYRQAAGLLVLAPIILRDPVGAYRTTRPGVLFFRALAGTLGVILAFYSYQELPLAEANALSFTRALWIAPFAAIILHERVGVERIAATFVGFLGVLVILRPSSGFAGFSLPALAALASSFLFAMTVTGMKLLTRDHSTTTIVVWSASLGLLVAIPPALFVWAWPTPIDLALLVLMGVLGLATQTAYINGMALGDAAAMAPIDYTRLIFAVLFGLLLFGEWPDAFTLLGAGVVIASTLFITVREARQASRNVNPPPDASA